MRNLTVSEARVQLDRLASWGIVDSFQHVVTENSRVGDVYVIGVSTEDDERVLVLSPHGLRGFLEGVCATLKAQER